MPIGMKNILLTPVKCHCKDCPDRTQNCHGKCETYAQYRAECDRVLHRNEMKTDVSDAIGRAIKRKGLQAKSGFYDV